MIQTGSQFGMQSLNMCLVSLLRQGKISRESAIQYTDNIAELQQMI